MALYANEGGTLKSLTGIYGYDFSGVASWSEGSDEDIKKMVQVSDDGALDLSLFWSVGDERIVTLNAMAATGVGESHASQEVAFVLMHKGGLTVASTNKVCGFVVGLRECLAEKGYMNSNNTSWQSCARRTWCNSIFYNSIPSAIRSIFKAFNCKTATEYTATTVTTTTDYFALPAEKEIFGAKSYSSQYEANALFQFNFYKTTANRIKHDGVNSSTAINWWERSRTTTGNFCSVSSSGISNTNNASSTANGLAPFGVI